ncbi:MAG: hypothetical protein OEY44_04085 [Candidatus Peregrinibacteria bacterium]|nr:hypothetical protein [Candidatus Peregrinibacteria bacterium]
MTTQDLNEKEQQLTDRYRAFLAQVREAFNKHCDEIKDRAQVKFDAIPEENEEGRKKVLSEQKAELDKTLTELKQLLNSKGAEVRRELEEIAKLKDEQSFDLEEQLEEVAVDEEKHAA